MISLQTTVKTHANAFSCSSSMPLMNQKVMNSKNVIQGKLHCPICSTKIGSWNWSGTPCSCGSGLTPAMQILASRVDIP
jgi:hypothetical protein